MQKAGPSGMDIIPLSSIGPEGPAAAPKAAALAGRKGEVATRSARAAAAASMAESPRSHWARKCAPMTFKQGEIDARTATRSSGPARS